MNENFVKGIQLFYETNKYKTASYGDIREAMEQASGIELTSFFNQLLINFNYCINCTRNSAFN